MDKMDPVLSYLTVGSALKLFFAYMSKDKKPKNLQCVGKISKLSVYPVKSMAGISFDSVECTQKGVKLPGEQVFDRSFMVVTRNGAFITARAQPRLPLVKPRLEGHYLILEAEGMEPLKLPKVSLRDQTKALVNTKIWFETEIQGQDCGQAASDWISKFLNKDGFRLIYSMDGLKQRSLTDPLWEDFLMFSAKQGDRLTFQDCFPFMLLSESSLEDLNSRLSKKVSMSYFRPNIVVDGTAPFEEDEWDDIWIGDVKFTHVRHCERCVMTTLNPEKGEMSKDGEPLKTLKAYRQHNPHNNPTYTFGPLFGINLLLDSPNGSVIKVGDHIYVRPKSQ